MAHGTRVNGTAYGITGGKCLISGVEYSIKKGLTLIGGTGYNIEFLKKTVVTVTKNSGDLGFYAVFNGGDRVYGYPNADTLEFDAGVPVSMTVYGSGIGGVSLYVNRVFVETNKNIEYTIDITGKTATVELEQYSIYGEINVTLE